MLTISIPDELDKQLSVLTNDKQDFIISAIEQKIALRKKYVPGEQLAKEYADGIDENEQITKDFIHSDNEHWNDY